MSGGSGPPRARWARLMHMGVRSTDLYRFFGHGHPRFKTQESYMLRQPGKRGKAWVTTSSPTGSGARPPTK